MNLRSLSDPLPTLDPIHDGRHQLRDLPLERESVPYVISLPDLGIGAFVYTWVSKDSIAGSAYAVFGPGMSAPLVEKVDGIAVPREMNFDNWTVGKLTLKHDLKLERARVIVDGERFGLDAEFTALHPAYAYSFHPDGCPDWAATDRTEQSGRLKGKLRIDGKEHVIDTTCARDHSWGTRDWNAPQHWKWLHAQAGDVCVHFWQMQVRGRTPLRGYVSRQGQLSQVVAVDVGFENDDQYRQTRIVVTVTDSCGRQLRIEGEYFAILPFQPESACTLNEGPMRCTVDGVPGVGWTEFMWPTAYLEYLRGAGAGR
ncbi:MAG: hypothetical protein V4650_00380 [Pseudomonadota bacterium]